MTRFAKIIAPAVALSVAFGGVAVPTKPVIPAAVAQTGTPAPVIDTTGFTVAEWEALTAQATLELINEYRVANGLHPLRTHVLYNKQALAWSKVMAADGDKCDDYNEKCMDKAHRHSDPDVWGWSGENVLFEYDTQYKASSLTKEQWARLAVKMFENWRKSHVHNENMLNTSFQGIGLGLKISSEKNIAFGTTQFFIEDTAFTKGYFYPSDAVTVQALNSNEPFYMAGGAMKALGITTADAPFEDTKGITPTYSGLTLTTQEGTSVVVDILGGRRGQASKNDRLSTEADPKIWTAPAKPKPTTPTTTTRPNPAPTTSAKPKPTTPTTTTRPNPAPTTTPNPAPTTSAKPKPTTPTTTTRPNPEGSSVGAIIGIVAGVLALIGLGAVAMGMMNGGLQLPF